MKIAYFDCFAGIAGDMTLGALLDCGVPLDALRAGLSSLPVEGWNIETQAVLKSGIHGLSVRISLDGKSDEEELAAGGRAATGWRREAGEPHHSHHEHSHTHEHSHSHHHEHEHSHHDHAHDSSASRLLPPASHIHGRSMSEIRVIIESSELSPRVKETSLKIFGRIAQVEAELHHSTPDEIHFHEIGGVDSLLDICGAAWCLEYLGVEQVYCSALPYSSGTVKCAHGTMPVPAPATLKLLQGAPLFPTGIRGEMITPTGAAIVAALAQNFGDPPAFVPQSVGFGAGKKNWPDRPNLLRIAIGETSDPTPHSAPRTRHSDGLSWQTLALVETNIDDMNPELFDFVLARLFATGALDVWLTPIGMKKNRPATMLSALCENEARGAVIATILRETTTLGMRVSQVERASLQREIESVSTKWGEVRVKIARWDEQNLNRAAPEYDDVARLASEQNVAAREIYAAALHAWQEK